MWAFLGLFQVFPCVHASCMQGFCLLSTTSRVVGHDDEKTNDSSRVSVCVEQVGDEQQTQQQLLLLLPNGISSRTRELELP